MTRQPARLVVIGSVTAKNYGSVRQTMLNAGLAPRVVRIPSDVFLTACQKYIKAMEADGLAQGFIEWFPWVLTGISEYGDLDDDNAEMYDSYRDTCIEEGRSALFLSTFHMDGDYLLGPDSPHGSDWPVESYSDKYVVLGFDAQAAIEQSIDKVGVSFAIPLGDWLRGTEWAHFYAVQDGYPPAPMTIGLAGEEDLD